MIPTADHVTVSVPRSLLSGIEELSATLRDRMHELLERNTDGQLSAAEQGELQTLVQMAQFGQIVSMAMRPAAGSSPGPSHPLPSHPGPSQGPAQAKP